MADIRQTTKVHVHTHTHIHTHTHTHTHSHTHTYTHTHTHKNPSARPISLQYHSLTHSLTYLWFKCSSSHIFSCCWSTFALFSCSSARSCSLSVTSFWMLASRANGSIAGSDLQRWKSSSCTHQHISVLHASRSKHSSHSLYLPYVPKTLVTDFIVWCVIWSTQGSFANAWGLVQYDAVSVTECVAPHKHYDPFH